MTDITSANRQVALRAAELLEEWAAVLWDSNVIRAMGDPACGRLDSPELETEYAELRLIAAKLRQMAASTGIHVPRAVLEKWRRTLAVDLEHNHVTDGLAAELGILLRE